MLKSFVMSFVLVFSAESAVAQNWPEKPVRIVVPYAAGGGTDIVARVLADRIGEALGQRFIVENKPGAGGMVGADIVAKSARDGYTLLVSSPAEIVVNSHVFKKISYDPLKDLAPITLIAWTPLVIAAHPSLNVSSPQELLALLKSKPGQLNYSSPGAGSGHHLAGELLKKIAGVDMQHVAYRGAGPAVQDAVSGQVPLTISGLPPVVELIKSNTLKAIAVTSAKRAKAFPNTPALSELGPEYQDFDITNWFGLFAPAGVSEAIRSKLQAAAITAISDTTMLARLGDQGAEPVANTPEQFAAFIRAESEKYGRIAKTTGVQVQQ